MNPGEILTRTQRTGSRLFQSPWVFPGLLLASTLAVFWSFLSPKTSKVLSLPDGDLSSILIWWYQFGFGELQKGHLALWNPYLCGGVPFFGEFQSALLYPPNWLLMVLPLPFALNLNFALHVFLSGWFTFLWVRWRGSNPASALAAAFGFMFGGATFLHLVPGHLPNLEAMAWIPLVFLALDGCLDGVEKKWILLGMFALSMQILSGHIQYCYYTVFTASLYAFLNLPWVREKRSFFAGWTAMGIGAGLLTAIQLLAGWEAAGESIRTRHLSMDFLNIASLTPERLWCLLMPNFFGGWRDYWGGSFYWEGVIFISVTAFLMALFALKVSPHPQKKIFAGLALFLVSLAIGTRLPLFAFFCKWVPLFGDFRGVGKFNVLITLCLLVLASLGMDEIFNNPQSLRGFGRLAGWISGISLLAAGLFFATPRFGGAWLFRQYLTYADSMALHLLLCGALSAGLALLARVSQGKPALQWLFMVAVFLELFFFAKDNLPFFDFKAATAKATEIQDIYTKDPGEYRISTPIPDRTLGARGWDIWGEDPVNSSRYARFLCATQGLDVNKDALLIPFFHQWPSTLGLLRLRYVLKEEPGREILEKTGFREPPRFFLTDHFEVLKPDEVLSQTLDPGFDPMKEVLLESEPGITPGTGVGDNRVSLKDISSDKIEIEANISRPTLLVVTDNYSQGWKIEPISMDSQGQYQVMPANGFQRATPLSTGQHHFYMEYRPGLFNFGKWISIFSWICFFALFVLKRRSL